MTAGRGFIGIATGLAIAALLALLPGSQAAQAQGTGLQVSISASPVNPQVNESTTLTATIANAPSGGTASYSWEIDFGGAWYSYGSGPTFRYGNGKAESLNFRLTISYDSGESATSAPVTVTWGEQANAPTPESTPEPTPEPTEEPTPEPTEEPTPEPTEEPTREPTEEPTPEPTEEPTSEPTPEPTPTATATPVPATPAPAPAPTQPPVPVNPSVTGVSLSSSPASGDTYLLGETIQVALTFSEAVDVTGRPQVSIDMDPADWGTKQVGYHSGSGSSTLTFTHTVVEPNLSTQGIAVLANTLVLNGGTIQSSSSQTDAALSHAGLAHDASHKVDWQQSPPTPTPIPTPEPTPIPTPPPAPSVTGVSLSSPASGDTYLLGETIQVALTFSEAVDVDTTGGTPTVAIDMDPADWGTKQAGYHSGSGSSTLTFTHTVVEPNLSTQGIAILANTLALNGGAIQSSSSQTDAALSHAGLAHDASQKVDWQQTKPNLAPVVNTQAELYDRFTNRQNAPRGFIVSKGFHGIFTDPDGDALTYTVSVPEGQRRLVEELSITLEEDVAAEALRRMSPGTLPRVFFVAEAEADWKAITPALADPLTITVTLTASDPGGLSASVDGDFHINWESQPALVSAIATRQSIELTFDMAVLDDPAPTPEQFTVNVVNGDGTSQANSVSSLTVNGSLVMLALASELTEGQTVTLDYAHDADTPLQRAGGGDPVPGFSGQAVELSLPPGPVTGFAVSAEPGTKALLVTWDAVEDATSYKLRWRKAGVNFQTANAVTVTSPVWVITVPDYGQWEVRAQACNDAGCGTEASASAAVVQAASLSLERSGSRTISAIWQPVADAASYTLRWERISLGSSATGEGATDASGDDGQTQSELTVSNDRTGAEFSVPDGGAYQVELRVRGDDNELVALTHTSVDQADDESDTTPPRLERGEIDGTTITLWFSEPLDETAVGGYFSTCVNTASGWVRGTSSDFVVSGNKVTVRGNPRAKAGSSIWGYAAGIQYHPPTGSGVSGLRDLAGNEVQRLPTQAYKYLENVTDLPDVADVAISSDAGDDGYYASGDAIKVKLTFRKAVNVTGTPRLKIDLDPAGGGEKWASYQSGSGTKELEFAYTVAGADLSAAGVAVLANTLELNGGTIRAATPGAAENVNLAHIGLPHNVAHRVATPSMQPPLLWSAIVSETTLTLTFSEALGAAASLSNDAFTVKKTPRNGSEQTVSLSGSPAISGATLTLTLASAALNTDSGVKVSYAKPTTGSNNKLVDADGAETASFTDEPVTNTLLDTTPPRLMRGEIDGDDITLWFSEPLDEIYETYEPPTSDENRFQVGLYFYVSRLLYGQCSYLSGISFRAMPQEVIIEGNRVELVKIGHGYGHNGLRAIVGARYNSVEFDGHFDPNNKVLRDLAGNAASNNRIDLDNVTRLPYPKSATVVGNRLTLLFSSPMRGGDRPAASAFTVKVNGSAVSLASANPVSVSGNDVTLTLAAAVASTDTVTVSYTKPDSNWLQGSLCEYAPSFTDEPVTNSTP